MKTFFLLVFSLISLSTTSHADRLNCPDALANKEFSSVESLELFTFDDVAVKITGTKVYTESSSVYGNAVFIENVRAVDPNFSEGSFFDWLSTTKYVLTASNSRAFSLLCSQITGGLYPHHHSGMKRGSLSNAYTSLFLKSNRIELLISGRKLVADFLSNVRGGALYPQTLICSDIPDNY